MVMIGAQGVFEDFLVDGRSLQCWSKIGEI
jgi:hypothetical protein